MNEKVKRWNLLLPAVALLGLGAGALLGPRMLASLKPPVEYSGHGNYINQAATVAEQTRAAQLVVKGRVIGIENRVLTETLPVYAEDGVTVTEERAVSTPFTDVTFLVADTLKGKSEDTITVLQTGGTLGAREGGGRERKFAIAGDPLFTLDSEHILFLVDITNDGVHSTGRQLYRVVNPLGRYELAADGTLRSAAAAAEVEAGAGARRLPLTEDDLRAQVEAAKAGG